MNIIGQDKLISKIDSYNNIIDFPNPILLCGKEGSGKHTICNYISNKFNIELCDISSLLTHENIIDLYTHPTLQLLIIDINKVGSSRQLIPIQNSILKFIEEPPSNKLVVILVEDSGKLLNTIVNRCQIWKLQEYTIDQLKLFCEKSIDENKFNIFNTPGLIKKYFDNEINETEIDSLISNIIDNISRASIPNILTISDKFTTNNSTGLDINIFISKLYFELSNRYIRCEDEKYFKALNKLKDTKSNLLILNVNKKSLLDELFISLKYIL